MTLILLKIKNTFSVIFSLYLPIIENTSGDRVRSVFLILSYFILLCETALSHKRVLVTTSMTNM